MTNCNKTHRNLLVCDPLQLMKAE